MAIILRNAYVFSLNPKLDFGRYSLLINEGRIADIIRSRELNPGEDEIPKIKKWIEQSSDNAEIVDCTNKIIIPALTNSCVKSEGSFVKYLLRKRHYESIEEDLSTDLIFNYIYREESDEQHQADLESFYQYSYLKNLKSGIVFLNELSPRKEINHIAPIKNAILSSGVSVNCGYSIKQEQNTVHQLKELGLGYYLTEENHLTLYDLSGIADLKKLCGCRIFLEISTNKSVTEKFRQVFGKSIVALLNEYNLIDSQTSLINPIYLDYEEMKILAEKQANVIICPRDLLNFSSRYFPLDDFISRGIKFSISTGWLGEDLFKEVRLLRHRYREVNIPSEELFRAITVNPRRFFFNDSLSEYIIDIGTSADLTFINLSDIRFQLLPENFSNEAVCDFLIDNLESNTISDVMIKGKFKVRDGKFSEGIEEAVIASANKTRKQLYKIGRYEDIAKKKRHQIDVEKLDMKSRDDDEIKLFSQPAEQVKEQAGEVSDINLKEDFRIKSKIPVFRTKTSPLQKNLFEELKVFSVDDEDTKESPELNLLYTEIIESKDIDDEILQAKISEALLLKHKPEEQSADKTNLKTAESKIQLPKNVKLKFGD